MSKKVYFTLAVREDGVWGPQFGDYDRETVEMEREEYRGAGIRSKNMVIVKSGPKQADIDAKIASLNLN